MGGEKNGNSDTSGGKHAAVRKRHDLITRMVREQGFMAIGALADHFDVTPQTVRRDINILCDQGRLARHHGGAGPVVSTENVGYTDRQVLYHEEKKRIAKLVVEHIPPRSSLFINMGTTNEEVAKELCKRDHLRVITNNLNVAKILSANQNIDILVAGGIVRHRDCGIVGESAIDFLRQFKVDYGIIGISGIDLDGTLLDFDYREVSAARSIINNSRKVFLVTDRSKFGRNAMVRLGSFSEIDCLFTDSPPPEEIMEHLRRHEVEMYCPDGAE
ncbi:DeoR/GlpR family DNA-binding transcription regulator [Salidesulfovibrio onnuriiensis]|uniref:DeoR/GlpR family DNA-binding transcription regulator n=1 Tax=Salidesulfovibrio onnuriiensis TaxID=2583823 RepID=UPI0011C87853|nr:DeoR family transcriptional regulator [Salidesulfovibrio onnuriiensis]